MNVQAATTTHYCKFPGCTNEAPARVGRYSYCDKHRGQSNGASAAKPGATVAARLGTLQGQAKRIDKLRAKAETLTRQALAAKQAADDAEREFRVSLRDLSADDE